MNIYCETNFFLELVFSNEQTKFCEKIINLCQKNKANLIIPAYSFAESLYKLEAQRIERANLQSELKKQLNQISRTTEYASQIRNFEAVDTFLTENIEREKKHFEKFRKILTKIAEIITFNAQTLQNAKKVESKFNLSLQDAIIFSSVLEHLKQNKPLQSCFLNRNAKDFNTSEIKTALKKLNCRYIPSFEHGLAFIKSQTK